MPDYNLLPEPIHILDLDERIVAQLERAGIYTIENLLHTKREELLELKNVGVKSVEHILTSLRKIGFSTSPKTAVTERSPEEPG